MVLPDTFGGWRGYVSIDTFDRRLTQRRAVVPLEWLRGPELPAHAIVLEVLGRSLREYAAPILVLLARFRRDLAGSADAACRLGVKKVLPKPLTRKELLAAMRESVEA